MEIELFAGKMDFSRQKIYSQLFSKNSLLFSVIN